MKKISFNKVTFALILSCVGFMMLSSSFITNLFPVNSYPTTNSNNVSSIKTKTNSTSTIKNNANSILSNSPKDSVTYTLDGSGYILNWLFSPAYNSISWGAANDPTMGQNLTFIDPTQYYTAGDECLPNPYNPLSGSNILNTWFEYDMTSESTTDIFSTVLENGNQPGNTGAYALCYLYFPSPVSTTYIQLYHDDGGKIWWDSQQNSTPIPVWYYHGTSQTDNIAIGSVSAGWHSLLIEIENNGGGWGFSCIMSSTNPSSSITPISNLVVSLVPHQSFTTDSNGYILNWLMGGSFSCPWGSDPTTSLTGSFVNTTKYYRAGTPCLPTSSPWTGSNMGLSFFDYDALDNASLGAGEVDLTALYGTLSNAGEMAECYIYFPITINNVYIFSGFDDGGKIGGIPKRDSNPFPIIDINSTYLPGGESYVASKYQSALW